MRIYLCTVWTDHANMISVAYSGTGALKTDFTKTGRRTRQGMFEDLSNSVMRYLKNNFFDGARQVCCMIETCSVADYCIGCL